MKSSLLIAVLAIVSGLLLAPALANSEMGQGASGSAPISQPLVREGTLAVRLADALNLGSTTSETEAESLLAGAGISPRNGWIADYPITPDIAGELQSAVGEAADGQRLALGREEALKAFRDVMTSYDMALRPSDAGQSGEGTSGYTAADPTVINNYYYDEGPPVVTYYAPPPAYYYLYSWVPYPFWWWNFWFPGFFVLLDFDVRVHGHDHFRHGHDEFATNHFRDPATGRMGRIDPAKRVQGATFSQSNRTTGWSSASAQRGAQAILNSRNAVRTTGTGMATPSALGNGGATGVSTPAGRSSGPPNAGSGVSRPPTGTERMFSAPAPRRASVAPSDSRGFNGSAMPMSRGRTFTAPSGTGRAFTSAPAVSRSFSSPAAGGRMFSGSSAMAGGSVRSFSGGSFGGIGRGR